MNSFHNPPALATPNGFSHVAQSTHRRTILVSGQVAYGPDGAVVGAGDLAAQTRQVYANLETALADAGASMRDVVKTTLFVKDLSPDKAVIVRAARAPFLAADRPPASTMVGVASLARPELLLEVEAMAMLD
ncbi:RidA family protein [Variovorax terrae]|uniref:RidA family protein n=1 Tax=Variovorax terrae TaxID=2923278 RepID=A0A9X1VYA5_9BURK|nr:RidA family protein [Variovorax terrae]MCJ0762788.1 RidA family protein [Variovorax terrae]